MNLEDVLKMKEAAKLIARTKPISHDAVKEIRESIKADMPIHMNFSTGVYGQDFGDGFDEGVLQIWLKHARIGRLPQEIAEKNPVFAAVHPAIEAGLKENAKPNGGFSKFEKVIELNPADVNQIILGDLVCEESIRLTVEVAQRGQASAIDW